MKVEFDLLNDILLSKALGITLPRAFFISILRSLLVVGELFCQKTDNLVHVGRHMFPKKIHHNGTQMFPEDCKRIVA